MNRGTDQPTDWQTNLTVKSRTRDLSYKDPPTRGRVSATTLIGMSNGRRIILISFHPASSTPPRKSVSLEVFTEWDAQSVSKSSPKFSEWTSPSAVGRSGVPTPLSAPPPPRAAATVAAAAVSLTTRPLPPPAPPPPRPRPTFKPRILQGELKVYYDFLVHGIDAEDINYLRRVYEMFLSQVLSVCSYCGGTSPLRHLFLEKSLVSH